MKENQRLCVGAIVGVHGVRGQVRVASFTAEPEALFTYSPLTDERGTRTFELSRKGVGKDHFIVALAGVSDRDQAEAMRGTELFVERSLLPASEDGTYYHADLIGLKAKDEAGLTQGIVDAVHDYGAGTFLEIKPAARPSFMLPLQEAFVPEVNLKDGFLRVVIPEGWLSEEKPEKPKRDKTKRKAE